MDLSLVDPDNRRPVDYEERRRRLARLDGGAPPADLDDEKLLVTSRALRLRGEHPEWLAGPRATYAALPTGSSHAIGMLRGRPGGGRRHAPPDRPGARRRLGPRDARAARGALA